MNPEAAREILFNVSVTACIAALGFTGKCAVDWYNGKENGKLGFLLGLAGILIAVIVSAFLYVKEIGDGDEPKEPENPVSAPVSDSSREGKTSGDEGAYVQGKSFMGGSYTGQINPETKMPEGRGQMYYNDGSVYDGSWKNGQRDGDGVMDYKGGDTYDGEWKNDKRDGYGTYTWQDGRRYIGCYKNDLRDGEGDYIGWTGFVDEYSWSGNYSGISKEDYFEGEGSFTFTNDDQFNGIFHANRFWDGTYTYADGRQFQIADGVPVV